MDVVGVTEVVRVRDDVEPETTDQRAEESLVDENAEIFDTILVGEAIKTAKDKLGDLNN